MAYLPPSIVSGCTYVYNVSPEMATPGQMVTMSLTVSASGVCGGITGVACSFAQNCTVDGIPATVSNGVIGARGIDAYDLQAFALPPNLPAPTGTGTSATRQINAVFQLADDAFGIFDPSQGPAGPYVSIYSENAWQTLLPFNIQSQIAPPTCPA